MDGTFLCGTDSAWKYRPALPQELVSRIIEETQDRLWQDEQSGTTVRSDDLYFYQPIFSGTEPVGIARVKIDLAVLAQTYAYLSFSGFSDLYLFSEQGHLLLPMEMTSATLWVSRRDYQNYTNMRLWECR